MGACKPGAGRNENSSGDESRKECADEAGGGGAGGGVVGSFGGKVAEGTVERGAAGVEAGGVGLFFGEGAAGAPGETLPQGFEGGVDVQDQGVGLADKCAVGFVGREASA